MSGGHFDYQQLRRLEEILRQYDLAVSGCRSAGRRHKRIWWPCAAEENEWRKELEWEKVVLQEGRCK